MVLFSLSAGPECQYFSGIFYYNPMPELLQYLQGNLGKTVVIAAKIWSHYVRVRQLKHLINVRCNVRNIKTLNFFKFIFKLRYVDTGFLSSTQFCFIFL